MLELVSYRLLAITTVGRQRFQFSTSRPFARVNGLDPIHPKSRCHLWLGIAVPLP